MTDPNTRPPTPGPGSAKIKAVGLISGGLDSLLAARIIKEQGIDVCGVHFALPWGGCGNFSHAEQSARQVDIPLKIIHADEDFLALLKNPKFGYGSAINPCVDCHVHMIQKAAAYMREINAHFVFTGEVLGQRPMSQLKNSMRAVEKNCGIEGLLVRPLCAKALALTIPEKEGWVSREKLLNITGRGRTEQIHLAAHFGIKDFPNAAGGCLLTDKNFGRRIKDLFQHGCQTLDDTVILRWGRHFRINGHFKAILARNARECDVLLKQASPDDHILELDDRRGPLAVLQGRNPSEEIFGIAAGLIQHFSRYRIQEPRIVFFSLKKSPEQKQCIPARLLTENEVERMWI